MDKLFEHIKENEFKLITESRPAISKIEEGRAVQLILRFLIPKAVKMYNIAARRWGTPELREDVARKLFKKVNIENFTNGQSIYYEIKIPGLKTSTLDFKITKLEFRKIKGDDEDRNIFDIAYYDFDQYNFWIPYSVENVSQEIDNPIGFEDQLSEDLNKPNRSISKKEEDEGLQYIRRVLIPYSAKYWNDVAPLHQHVTEKEISFNLIKTKRVPATLNTSDIIYYVSRFRPSAGGGSRRNSATFKFATFKDEKGKLNGAIGPIFYPWGGYSTLQPDGKTKETSDVPF